MKKLICLLLVLTLLGMLWACGPAPVDGTGDPEPSGSSAPPETEPPTETGDPSTEPPTEPEPPETERVSVDNQVDFTPEGDVTANVTDAINVTFTDEGGNTGVCVLPRIELPGPNVEAINAEILADHSVHANINWIVYSDIHYEWFVNGDILTVIIVCQSGESSLGYEERSVYNISISKCRLVSNEEIYALSGMENVQTRVLHAVACYTGEYYSQRVSESVRDMVFQEGSRDHYMLLLFEMGIRPEVFELATPYLDQAGQLCVMAEAQTIAGAGHVWAQICVEDYETDTLWTAEEYYEYYAALAG